MEENNGLQDILLDKNEEEKTGKVRKILMGVATLVVLFLVVLIIVKYLNSGSDDENTNENGGNTIVLPDEPKASDTTQPSSGTEIFQQVPIASDSKESFENIVNDYKNSRADANSSVLLPNSNAENEIIQNTPAVQIKEVEMPKQDKNLKNSKAGAKEAKKQVEKAKSEQTLKVANQKATKSTTNSSLNSGATSGSYIQVASVTKFDANNPLIKKISQSGFSYKTYKANIGGKEITKILIGPFSDAELGSNMAKVRQNISDKAFIFKIK